MKILSWNYKGINNPHTLSLPYLVWLCRVKNLHFPFLFETKMVFGDVVRKPNFLNPSSCFGYDANGSRGGLVAFAWYCAVVNLLYASTHIVACNVLESNRKGRHFVYVYGAPKVEERQEVLDTLSSLVVSY